MRVHRNCCGLDVHKQTIAACLISESEDGTSSHQKRIFGTMTQQLRELAQWLAEAKVTAVAMEATGIYWVPVWNVLNLEARILHRLRECKEGEAIESLAAFLSTSVGDVRAALYDLVESECVRFSNGMWRLE